VEGSLIGIANHMDFATGFNSYEYIPWTVMVNAREVQR